MSPELVALIASELPKPLAKLTVGPPLITPTNLIRVVDTSTTPTTPSFGKPYATIPEETEVRQIRFTSSYVAEETGATLVVREASVAVGRVVEMFNAPAQSIVGLSATPPLHENSTGTN
jgi:hypothetical protein